MGKDRDTPVTGRAIPRPRPVEVVDFSKLPSGPPAPPITPTPQSPKSLDELYRLIDERLSPQIVERISSAPPPGESKPAPRHSLPVRVAVKSPKWLAYLLAGLTLIGQIIAAASKEEYRGPIVQGVKLIAFAVSEAFSEDPEAPPELAPEPVSPLLPAGE